MREIKFRAWDSYNEKMIYEFSVNFQNSSLMSIFDIPNDTIDDIDLMQYTGLKDKNDVEIYEGDILVAKNKKDSKENDWIGIIEDNNYGWLALKYKEYVNPSWFGALCEPVNDPQNASWIINNCEVIGNIYENRELLN